VAYISTKEILKSNWVCLINIIHRALRILPAFLFAIMIYAAFYPYLSSGPLWLTDKGKINNCINIWKVVLFIDNLIGEGSGLCYAVGWYLYVDMQLYAMSMPILLLYKYKIKLCKILIWVFIVIGIVQLFIYCQLTGFSVPVRLIDLQNSYPFSWRDQYIKPWKWMAAYFFGLFMGILYY
jgi:peptidoglycan/LPS O-acetylase OafA/YrhL